MSEKLCLQWNDFKSNVNTAFASLRDDSDFADVTLACEDGQQIKSHKVILAASSPFFQRLLVRNKHPHPLIYMRGVTSENLTAIVDFLYCGEANVFQENLDSFLAIAEELELKGLMGGSKDEKAEGKSVNESEPVKRSKPGNWSESTTSRYKDVEPKPSTGGSTIVALPSGFSGDLRELDEKVKSMMEKTQSKTEVGGRMLIVCKVCGKEGQHTQIRNHIEANHIEGTSIPCVHCEKTFRSRKAQECHKYNYHK